MRTKIAYVFFSSVTIVAILAPALAQQDNTFSAQRNRAASPNIGRTKNMNEVSMEKFLPSSIPLWSQNLGPDTVVLDVTASTNFPAYRLMIKRNGDASYECGPSRTEESGGEQRAKAPAELTTKIFHDLEKCWPLSATAEHVMKSASFGTYSYISYKGAHSADMDALVHHNAGAQALRADFQELRKCF